MFVVITRVGGAGEGRTGQNDAVDEPVARLSV